MTAKTKRLRIRVSDEEEQAIKNRANEAELTPSEYVRRVTLGRKADVDASPLYGVLYTIAIENSYIVGEQNKEHQNKIHSALNQAFEILNRFTGNDEGQV